MNFAFFVSISASSTLSDMWNVYSVVEPVFRFFNFVWFTGFLCCLRKTHAESTSYGSPSRRMSLFGNTSLYDNIPSILARILHLSTFRLILQDFDECVLFFIERSKSVFLEEDGRARKTYNLIYPLFLRDSQTSFNKFGPDSSSLETLVYRETSDLRQSCGVNCQRAATYNLSAFNGNKKFACLRQMALHQLPRILAD